jgi:translation initiation factor 5B
MRRLPLLLHRFGCLAYHGKRGHDREVFISGRSNVTAFVKGIGFLERRKMEAAKSLMASSTTNRVFEITPPSGEFVKKVRLNHQVIWDRHLQPTSYDDCGQLSRAFLAGMFSAVPSCRNDGLASILAGYCAVKIASLENLEGDFAVYDFSVSETHNFLANGLIIHNTSLLDALRGTGVQAREAGGITQQIGASYFPPETLSSICGDLMKGQGGGVKIPGLLVIDTPGHEAFSNLRMRGGSAADLAILVVDVTKGLEPQTLESIEILRARKVPFVVALNKIDLLAGWRPKKGRLVVAAQREIEPATLELLDQGIYRVVGQLSRLGFNSDAYYRVQSFTKQVSIVPVSAHTGEGLSELMAVVVGLTQQFMGERLKTTLGPPKGIVLEVKDEAGLGETANVILVDGVLRVGSIVVVGKREGTQSVKIRALLEPKPLDEMRDPRDRFTPVQEVVAAAGVKLSAPDLEGVLAGSPIVGVAPEQGLEEAKRFVDSAVKEALIQTDILGVVLKADTLGALEAITGMLKKKGVPVRVADIGHVNKRDLVQAESVMVSDRYLGIILAFDVKVLEEVAEDAKERGVRIFSSEVIYNLIDEYTTWVATEKENEQRATLSTMTPPCKFRLLKGLVFRRSGPAVFGIEVLEGTLRSKVKVMNASGEEVGVIQQLQNEGNEVESAQKGEQVAISMKEPVIGRQVKEEECLYTLPSSDDARLFKTRFADRLSPGEMELLDGIISMRRRVQYMYAF